MILCVIPARKGSKGIKNKNIKEINKIPLVTWAIRIAKKSRFVDEIIVSSDSKKILNIAENKKVIAHARNSKISQDKSTTYEAIDEILKDKRYNKYSYIVCIEPTSPFTLSKDVDLCIKDLISNKKAKSLVSVGVTNQIHPEFLYRKDKNNLLSSYLTLKKNKLKRRQDVEPLLYPDGSVYISEKKTLIKEKNFISKKTMYKILRRMSNIEIDDNFDLLVARSLAKYKNLK